MLSAAGLLEAPEGALWQRPVQPLSLNCPYSRSRAAGLDGRAMKFGWLNDTCFKAIRTGRFHRKWSGANLFRPRELARDCAHTTDSLCDRFMLWAVVMVGSLKTSTKTAT